MRKQGECKTTKLFDGRKKMLKDSLSNDDDETLQCKKGALELMKFDPGKALNFTRFLSFNRPSTLDFFTQNLP
jgi:hypothetical protein